ncbi:MAG: tRNA-dihydrouridine synthase, partial [Candidatus Vogelbacteria bacterium]|nr:tRNA-dihydrouridine synthase [Candidatus Vogelbacteria bacterium]
MVKGFWEKLKKPIFALAPMADVTDAAFRRIIVKYGKPDVMWTEFVSCDGLCSSGKPKLLKDLWFTDIERPIVAQFFGAKPENFYRCAKLALELGFDGIDINMGCPDRSINKQMACAELINNPELAKMIIRETKRGAENLPVSVKTRVGYNKENLDEWLKNLLSETPAAIVIHARTKKELSLVPARWELIARAKEIAKDSETLVIGNGDVKDLRDAYNKINQTGADGTMLGRAVFGNPWLFSDYNRTKSLKKFESKESTLFVDKKATLTLSERLKVMLEHAELFDELYTGIKSFALMRKHFGSYVGGFSGAKELRVQLMEAENSKQVQKIVE